MNFDITKPLMIMIWRFRIIIGFTQILIGVSIDFAMKAMAINLIFISLEFTWGQYR